MKFGKRLQSHLEETIPEWRDKFLSYKHLKKRLKLITAPLDALQEEKQEEEEGNGIAETPSGLRAEQGQQARSSEVASLSANGDNRGACADEDESEEDGATRTFSSCNSGVIDAPNKDIAKSLTPEELDFVSLLNAEVDKFNSFFIDKEEEFVIRLQELKERIESVRELGDSHEVNPSDSSNQELIDIRKDLVNFHGEMVLLENYSSLNYTGVVKILKKHDKHTGVLLRMPYIQNVLHQPFFTTELLSKLVRECERNLLAFLPTSFVGIKCWIPCHECSRHFEDKLSYGTTANHMVATNTQELILAEGGQRSHGEKDVERIYKSTMAALRTIKDLRRGSSTYSIFSLPPFSQVESNSYGCPIDGSPCCAQMPVCTTH